MNIKKKKLKIDTLIWETFIYENNKTIKLIIRKDKKATEVYTLTLKENNFTFTGWDSLTLQKVSKIGYTDFVTDKYISWGIQTLRNQPFEENKEITQYDFKEAIFMAPIRGIINSKSELAQALYREPGIENLSKLLFGKEKKIIKNQRLNWDDLEAIYDCPWENKAEIFQKIELEYGKYINLFHNPEQFTNNIYKIEEKLIGEYLDRKLPKIPQELKIKENIEEYLRTKIQEDQRRIPKCLEEIHTLLGDPVRRKIKVSAEATTLRTDNLYIIIQHSSHFPMLLIESKIPKETEILLCEELGMRSHSYTPSKLKRYKL